MINFTWIKGPSVGYGVWT